ncbi:transglutaminase-like putative cysteine protease [Bacillus pakistanensis]|uniref:Transglutaminase-like putative cysteine protease n=1 Tax=Rossellomorea pakistanensis TaxID=992288 RepID=A0ABS2NKX5_9BACI|nr:transglutaminase domain-containing protein [Bacillus pakistanensis]MBM7588394.1 transglutaminase-like putative cysteine protease [Bacillus pakistanensis]
MSAHSSNKIQTIVLYLLGFFLLWEWLRPLQEITDTGSLTYFVVFIALSFVFYYLKVHWILSVSLKAIFIMYALQALYIDGAFLNFLWVGPLLQDFIENIRLTIGREWYELSFIYRSLLFFILLWLMAYLIQYWLMIKKTILLFYIMTIVYITILDTFTAFDGSASIIRVIIFGFLLMGILALQKIVDKESLIPSRIKAQRWIIPLVFMVGVSSTFALAGPKADPIWPDPVPFLQSFADGAGGTGVSKIGYGTDDTALGGPFIGDDSVVFQAEVKREHYWKIETKDLYTGKGWETSTIRDSEAFFKSGEPMAYFSYFGGLNESTPIDSEKVMVEQPYSHIVYPYGMQTVKSENTTFNLNFGNEKITTYQNYEEVKLDEYIVDYKNPNFSLKALRSANGIDVQEMPEMEPIINQFTQLPEGLPQRVKDLAIEITAEEETLYEKVKAIEAYFSQKGYVYDQFDVPVPEENQDYVDQFLFETKRGYCDNFSTSMVVLVRSLGIPARWAKGYTEGEHKKNIDSEYDLYEISNNNAHSWVEVLFPEVGWVPFEPTVGFSNNVTINYDLDLPESTPSNAPETEKPSPDKTIKPESDPGTSEDSSFSFKEMVDDVKTFFVENWTILFLIFIGSVIAAVILFRFRGRWFPYYLIYYYRFKKDADFSSAYLSLLYQLRRYGLKMDDGQTLRAYSRYIDTFFGTREMSILTSRYEKGLYGQEHSVEDWTQMRELWENLIKRTTG